MRKFPFILWLILLLLHTPALSGSPDDGFEEIRQRAALRQQRRREKVDRRILFRRLANNDPATFLKVARFFDDNAFMRSPIHLDDQWVLFVQPDGSLTAVDVETGSTVLRNRVHPHLRFDILAWTKEGDKLYGKCSPRSIHADKVLEISLDRQNNTLSFQPTTATPDFSSAPDYRSDLFTGRNQLLVSMEQLEKTLLLDPRHNLPSRTLAVVELPEDGLAYIHESKPGGRTAYKLACRNASQSWSGTLHTLEDLILAQETINAGQPAFDLVGNEQVVIYAASSGRMECIERATGKSRWIYVFPVFSIPKIRYSPITHRIVTSPYAPEEPYAWGPFYTDMVRVAAHELSTEGIAGLTADGETIPPRNTIIVDPLPDTSYADDLPLIAILAYLIPTASVALLYFLHKSKASFWLLLTAALALFCGNDLIYTHWLGGYSRPTTILMYIAIASCVAALFIKRPSANKPKRNNIPAKPTT